MSNVHPQGTSLKKAIQWVAEQRSAGTDKKPSVLADEAAFRYDLSPKDSEFLIRFLKEEAS